MARKKIIPHNQLWLITDLADEADSITAIRARESKLRTEAEIRVEKPSTHNFPPLVFPQRWELLKAETEKRNVPIKPLIMPVQKALGEIEKERRQILETSMGRLFIISGVSGSGKSTFLNSLDLFIDGVSVQTITVREIDRVEVIEDKLATLKRENAALSVVVLEGKESPGALKSDELDILLTTINKDFRLSLGRKTLFVIPTTSQSVAQTISQRAADIGGMTTRSRPFYVFSGPPRSEYEQITDRMLRALNQSSSV
jgi:DNA (cytosine-5)-methyltransferase 1